MDHTLNNKGAATLGKEIFNFCFIEFLLATMIVEPYDINLQQQHPKRKKFT